MKKENIIALARRSIIEADEYLAMELIENAISQHMDLLSLLQTGFGKGHEDIAKMFEKGDFTLPELIYSTEVMKRVTEKIDTHYLSRGIHKKGTFLIATCEGDAHDIGKAIVGATLKTYGIDVIDLGRDVPVSVIIENAVANDVDIIGTSALLTTTLVEQKKLEDALRNQGLRQRFFTIVGGAPCTSPWADKIGADVYAIDAMDTVTKSLAFLLTKKVT